jgi:hypothetical protein
VIEQFFNQEAEYTRFLQRGGSFICNGLGMGTQWHRVHKSGCNMLDRAGPAKHGLHTSVKKACGRSLPELMAWLEREYGPEGQGYSFCAFCFRSPLA